jgi:putative peptide zinc metalloprotease protein
MGAEQHDLRTLQLMRPRRAPGCTLERQQLAGAPAYILKDVAGERYMKLSAEGEFLWRQIDDARSIGDLCAAHVARFEPVAVNDVLRALARLVENGFVTFDTQSAPLPAPAARRAGWRSLCVRYIGLSGMDGRVAALYRVTRALYRPFVQATLVALATTGAVAFAWHCMTGPTVLAASLPRWSLVWMASLALHVLAHEAAHALTCKHFGRAVHRVGIGWYYFAPVAFVDTSDMWAAARWPRILVSAAGPYANLVLGGIASLVALTPVASTIAIALWSFAGIGYALAIVNMNPLLELDGYYVLMDLLEIPNLRARALARLGSSLRGSVCRRREPREHLMLLFGAASLAFGVATAVGLLLACHAWIGGLLAPWLPQPGAHAIGWALAGIVSLIVLHRLLEGLRPNERA